MTMLNPPPTTGAAPSPTVLSEHFWAGCAEGELRFQRCEDCGQAVHTPALVCSRCWSRSLRWEVSSGRGAVYSWTVVWRGVTAEHPVPYALVIVDVEEGWQMMAALVDCAADAVYVGQAVTVTFTPVGDFAVPCFRPVS